MTTTPDTFTNYATSTIAGGVGGAGSQLGASDTTLLCAAGDGNLKFPGSGPYMLQIGSALLGYELVKVTARSSDTMTIVRAQEGTTAVAWAFGTTIEQVFTAGNAANLWTATKPVFNVCGAAYGAKCDGSTDDTTAIQAAITACQNAGGGQVVIPGPSVISATLTITADDVQLVGVGRSAQLIAKSGFPSAAMVWVEAPGSGLRLGVVIRDLALVNTVNSSAIGIQLDSTYYAVIERCAVEGVYAENIYLNGTSGQVGAYTHIAHCHLGATTGGASSGGFGVLTNNHEFNTIEACVFNWFTTGRAVKLQNDNNVVAHNTFDECGTGVDVAFQPRNIIAYNQFDRGLTRYIYLESATQTVVIGNVFGGQGSGASGTKMIEVTGSSQGGNVIHNNIAQAGTTGWTTFYDEDSGVGGMPNLITNNQTAGQGIALQTGIARGNGGYNPVQSLATPVAPTVGNAGTGGTVAAGAYGVKVTYVSESGETAASTAASTTTTGSTSTITVTAPPPMGNAYGWYAYVTQPNGATYTRQQSAGSPSAFGSNLTLTAPPSSGGATAPGSNTTADVTTPSMPATTVPQQNTTGVDVTVYLTGGTVTAVAIGGKTTGLTSGAFRLPAYQTITVTYTGSPTWVWVGS